MNGQCSHTLKSHNGKAQPLGNDTQPQAYARFLSDSNQNQKRMEIRRESVILQLRKQKWLWFQSETISFSWKIWK